MLIDKLKIQKFRGISQDLSLDLTAPLTVIYAPNGTGKTSVCDSLEWLLCGSVGRLTLMDKGEVKCRFGNDLVDTFVEAVIPFNQESFTVRRVLTGSSSQVYWKNYLSDYKKSTDQDLLRNIVTGLPPAGSSIKSKVDWVRSTRFLDTESLNLLIDSDDESNDTRKLIFSNLFGVSDFQKSENQLNKILRKLPAERTIQREVKKNLQKIEEIKTLINKQKSELSNEYNEIIKELLINVSRNLKYDVSDSYSLDVQELYNKLQFEFIRFKADVERRKNSLNYVEMNVSQYEGYLAKIAGCEKEISKSKNELDEIKSDFESEKTKFERLCLELESCSKNFNSISGSLDKLKLEFGNVDKLFECFLLPNVEGGSFEERKSNLIEVLEHSNERLGALNNKLSIAQECTQNIPEWNQKSVSLNNIKKELGNIDSRLLNRNVANSLSNRLSEVKMKLDNLRTSRQKALGELELLISSGKKFVSEHPEVNACPLCNHEYREHNDLRVCIEENYSKLSISSKEEAVLATEYDNLALQLQTENNLLTRYKNLEANKYELVKYLTDLEDKFIALGLSKEELENSDLTSERLLKIREGTSSEIKAVEAELRTYRDALEASNKLEGILLRVRAIIFQYPQYTEISGINIDVVDRLTSSPAVIIKTIHELMMSIQAEINILALKVERASLEVKQLDEKRLKKEKEIMALNRNMDKIVRGKDEFIRKWRDFSEDDNFDKGKIKKFIEVNGMQRSKVEESLSILKRADEYFERKREANSKKQEISLLETELKSTSETLDEWFHQQKAREVIQEEISAIQNEVKRFVSREIKPLSDTISTLYLRAQGNKFINSISAEPTDKGLLKWIAELDENGTSFDVMQALSQGQRQDLALSIFLARARSLGGTYFLDEPLAHLDDLNRVALLDTLRLIVSEESSQNHLRLVLTTASKNLLRHLKEKFSLVERRDGSPVLRIYKMQGNPKLGLVAQSELVSSSSRLF